MILPYKYYYSEHYTSTIVITIPIISLTPLEFFFFVFRYFGKMDDICAAHKAGVISRQSLIPVGVSTKPASSLDALFHGKSPSITG